MNQVVFCFLLREEQTNASDAFRPNISTKHKMEELVEFSLLIRDSGFFLCFFVMKRVFLMNENNTNYAETIEASSVNVS